MTVSDSEQSEPGPGQELTDSDTENHWGPGQELTQWPQPSFFRNQVFFDYDPSSSTSLLSSVGITTRRSSVREKVGTILQM